MSLIWGGGWHESLAIILYPVTARQIDIDVIASPRQEWCLFVRGTNDATIYEWIFYTTTRVVLMNYSDSSNSQDKDRHSQRNTAIGEPSSNYFVLISAKFDEKHDISRHATTLASIPSTACFVSRNKLRHLANYISCDEQDQESRGLKLCQICICICETTPGCLNNSVPFVCLSL